MALDKVFDWFFILTLLISSLVSSTISLLTFHLISSFVLLGSLLFFITTRNNFKISPADLLVFFLLVSATPSWFYSVSKYHTTLAIIHSLTLFLYYLMARDHLKKRTLLVVVVVLPIVFSLFSFWQYYGGFQQTADTLLASDLSPAIKTALLNRLTEKRVIATFALPNTFAGYLSLTLLLLMGFFSTKHKDLQKLIIFSMLLVVINLFLTRSFGGLLSLGAVALLIVIMKPKIVKTNSLVTLLLVLMLVLATREGYRRYGQGETFKPTDSIQQRKLNFQAALNIFQDNMLLGTGAGTFGDVYLKYQPGGANVVKYTHNLPLQFAAEQGLVGLTFFILFWLYYFIRGKSLIKEGYLYWYLAGIVFFLHNLVDIDYNILSIGLLFWSIIAVLFKRDETFSWQVPHIYVAVFVWSLVLPLLVINSRWFYAERLFIKASEVKQNKELLLEEAVRFNSFRPEYFAYLGRLNQSKYIRSAKGEPKRRYLEKAITNLEKAVDLAPTDAYYYAKLAIALAIDKDKERAVAAINKARELHPQNPEYAKVSKRIASLP